MNQSQLPNNKTKPEILTCESCGKVFSCGAKIGKCWCFEVDMTEEHLAKLQEDFKNCLCQNCLESYGEKEK